MLKKARGKGVSRKRNSMCSGSESQRTRVFGELRAACSCRVVKSRGMVVRCGNAGSWGDKEYAAEPPTTVSKCLLPWLSTGWLGAGKSVVSKCQEATGLVPVRGKGWNQGGVLSLTEGWVRVTVRNTVGPQPNSSTPPPGGFPDFPPPSNHLLPLRCQAIVLAVRRDILC